MKRYLENEKRIKFKDINGEFVIREIVGRGASCVVYRADFYNEFGRVSEHLLKEYNPKDINMCRDDEASLHVNSESDMKRFEQGLSDFIEGYKKQELLRRNAELKNYTANVQNLYEGYGTIFIDMNVTEGMSYANVTEKSLCNLAKRMKVLAQVVGEYHRNGYLHLDLKPNNIYVRPEKETCEDVLLFDFDSLAKKEDIGKGTRVSYTNAWAPLELTSSSRRGLICEATDIFSLGEIFFEKLMGRHSGIRERRSFSKYEYDFESDILKNVNPKVTVLLDEFFRKTLCNTVSERYQSVDSLVNVMDEIIRISNPNEPYLKSSCPEPQEFFVGRDNELRDIHSLLMDSKILFLSGMGGIGKSELAKNYAKIYKDHYDVVVFVPYVSNLISAFGSDEVFPIYNVYKYPEEKMDEYCKRKFRKIKELCDERTLIIVDNFDLTEDDMLEEILKFNCKILFTTRMDFSEYNRAQKVIDTIEDKNVQVDIFKKYYTKELSDADKLYVKEIIEIVAGHTMTIELLAKQMMAGRVKPDKMLERLKETGISESGKEKVAVSKDDNFKRGSAYEHILALFDLANLNEDEKNVLSNLALMPYTGILADLFVEWCELEDFDVVNKLIYEGWIKHNNKTDKIALHPLMAELIVAEFINDKYCKILSSIIKCLAKMDDDKINSNERECIANFLFQISSHIVNRNIKIFKVTDFLCYVARYYEDYGHREEAIKYCEKAVQICLILGRKKDLNMAILHQNLGSLYLHQGKLHDAENKYIQAIEIFKNLDGDKSKYIAGTYNSLGIVYRKQSKYDKAEESLLNSLEIRKNIYGKGHLELAMTYNNLGIFYYKIHDYVKSKKFYFSAYDIWKKNCGELNDKIATLHDNLGCVYMEESNIEMAEEEILKAKNIRQALYGEIHETVAISYNNLAYVYYCKEHVDKAEEYIMKALSIIEKMGDDVGIAKATIYLQAGNIYFKQAKYELSETYMKKAIVNYELTYGIENVETAIAYNNLGVMYREYKEMDKAEKYCEKAHQILIQIEGETSYWTSKTYVSLANIYFHSNRREEAKEYYYNAFNIRKRKLGEEHNETIAVGYTIKRLFE